MTQCINFGSERNSALGQKESAIFRNEDSGEDPASGGDVVISYPRIAEVNRVGSTQKAELLKDQDKVGPGIPGAVSGLATVEDLLPGFQRPGSIKFQYKV